jgi:hypothetical protein
MSTSAKKGIHQSLILKPFLPYPTLSADTTLPLEAFDIDFLSIFIKEESDHSHQDNLTAKNRFVQDQYKHLPIGNNMAEIEDHNNLLTGPGTCIHSRGKSYSNEDITVFDRRGIKPTMNSKSNKAHFRIASPRQTTGETIPSHQSIACANEENKTLQSSLPTKRKFHLDHQDILCRDNIADVNRDQEDLIQRKRNRADLQYNPSDIAIISDNAKSSSFGTEESSSSFADATLDTVRGEKASSPSQNKRKAYNDTLHTLKSLDSASPPLPTVDADEEQSRTKQPGTLPPSNDAEGQVTAAISVGNNTASECMPSDEGVGTAESNQATYAHHADYPRYRERSEKTINHSRRVICDEHPGLSAIQEQDSLAIDDLDDSKVATHHEPVDSWQAFMEQQNVKDEKGHHPSFKHHFVSSDGYKKHSFSSSYSGTTTHPYKHHHGPSDFYPPMPPYYQHHPSITGIRKHSNHSTGQTVPLLSMPSSSRSDARPQGFHEWRTSSDVSEGQVAKKHDYHTNHNTGRDREHQIYPYQEYDYHHHHNTMYDYHEDLHPTSNFGAFEDDALPPVPPLNEAQYLSERGDNVAHPPDPYAIHPSSRTNVFDRHEPYDYHGSDRRYQPSTGVYGSYNEYARDYSRKRHQLGYHTDSRQHMTTYHGGRHRVLNSTSSGYNKSRSNDSGSTSSLSSSFFYSQQTPGANGLQPYYNRQVLALSTEDDENWLSEFLCFVRSQCVEVFSATREDVASRMNSKKVLFGQVGIRCRFCAHLPHRERTGRSSSFPSSISRIYQSLTMMLRDHFTKCHAMPPPIQERYLSLKANASQGATDSKKYWIESAHSLGLVDTTDGIRFRNQCHPCGGAEPLVILEEERTGAEEQENAETLSSV